MIVSHYISRWLRFAAALFLSATLFLSTSSSYGVAWAQVMDEETPPVLVTPVELYAIDENDFGLNKDEIYIMGIAIQLNETPVIEDLPGVGDVSLPPFAPSIRVRMYGQIKIDEGEKKSVNGIPTWGLFDNLARRIDPVDNVFILYSLIERDRSPIFETIPGAIQAVLTGALSSFPRNEGLPEEQQLTRQEVRQEIRNLIAQIVRAQLKGFTSVDAVNDDDIIAGPQFVSITEADLLAEGPVFKTLDFLDPKDNAHYSMTVRILRTARLEMEQPSSAPQSLTGVTKLKVRVVDPDDDLNCPASGTGPNACSITWWAGSTLGESPVKNGVASIKHNFGGFSGVTKLKAFLIQHGKTIATTGFSGLEIPLGPLSSTITFPKDGTGLRTDQSHDFTASVSEGFNPVPCQRVKWTAQRIGEPRRDFSALLETAKFKVQPIRLNDDRQNITQPAERTTTNVNRTLDIPMANIKRKQKPTPPLRLQPDRSPELTVGGLTKPTLPIKDILANLEQKQTETGCQVSFTFNTPGYYEVFTGGTHNGREIPRDTVFVNVHAAPANGPNVDMLQPRSGSGQYALNPVSIYATVKGESKPTASYLEFRFQKNANDWSPWQPISSQILPTGGGVWTLHRDWTPADDLPGDRGRLVQIRATAIDANGSIRDDIHTFSAIFPPR